jgi:hypothetical protein
VRPRGEIFEMQTRSANLTARQRREDSLKLKKLRALIKAGVDALDRGDFIEVADADLDDLFRQLMPIGGKSKR